MLDKSFGLMFFLKTSKNSKKTEKFIYARVTVDGDSREIYTKRVCEVHKWNQGQGRAMGNKEDVRQLNAFLDSFQMKILQAKIILMDNNKHVTAENIKNILLGKTEDRKLILEVF
jgi:hypothetical protein